MISSQASALRGAGYRALLLCFVLTGAHGQQNSSDVIPGRDTGDQSGFAAADPSYADELRNLRQNYDESMTNGAYGEATVVAKQLIELSIVRKGPRNLDTATALADLGHAQHHDEAYDAAVLNFQASIDMLQHLENNLSGRLIDPLQGLGRAQLANGRPDLAVGSFERAVHINNVNEGPMNLRQTELLEDMADSLSAAGDLKRASMVFDRIHELHARAYGADTAEILPTLHKRAVWSHDNGLFHEEQNLYRQMIRIAERAQGRGDLALIAPLTGLAYSYLYADSTWRLDQRFLSSITSAESFLKRSLRIVRRNQDATWEDERDALLALADFYLFASDFSGARRYYGEAWEFLSGDRERLESRSLHLEKPVRLQLVAPPKYVTPRYNDSVPPEISAERKYRRGYVIAEFDVTAEGRSSDVRLVEANPAGLNDVENEVIERLERVVYRPRHENGIPVSSRKLVYRHDFFYLPSDIPAERR